jgi:hypothetical protein
LGWGQHGQDVGDGERRAVQPAAGTMRGRGCGCGCVGVSEVVRVQVSGRCVCCADVTTTTAIGASVGLGSGSGSGDRRETSRALLKGRKVGGWAWALGVHLPRPHLLLCHGPHPTHHLSLNLSWTGTGS